MKAINDLKHLIIIVLCLFIAVLLELFADDTKPVVHVWKMN